MVTFTGGCPLLPRPSKGVPTPCGDRFSALRVVLLGATAAATVALLIASVMAYCTRPRVAVTPGAVFISVVVPEGKKMNQDGLLRRLNAPEFAAQLKAATRHRRLLSRLVAEEHISFSLAPPGSREVGVHGSLPRMCAVESSRYELVRWLQQRLPGMPDSAELIELQTEADAPIKRPAMLLTARSSRSSRP